MRKPLVLLGALAIAAPLATPAGAGDRVPFKGSDTGSFAVEWVSLDPPIVSTPGTYQGHATHLGEYTLMATEFVNLATLEITEGEYTLTAANGDTITGTYEGDGAAVSSNQISWDVRGPVSGGTGRFADAEGWLRFEGLGTLAADLSAGTGGERISGWISSPGAAKKP